VGYVREKIQVLADKFSLAAPGDKLPKTSILLGQNFRVDRAGKLVQRWGYWQKYAIAGAGFAHSSANMGGDETDYYTAANAIGAASNPCSVYYNGGSTPIVSGLSGFRVGFAPMNGVMWIMDRNVQGYYDGAQFWAWGITAPLSPPAAAAGSANVNGPNGDYEFYATFESTDETYETNPSPLVAVSVTNQDVTFSDIPVSDDPRVGTVNIYASGGTLGGAYLCVSVPNGTTTATWNTNDLTITNDGIQMPTDHGLPPAGCGLVGPYFSALYTWVGNRLFYTPPDQPQYWNTDEAEGAWVDVGDDGEAIIWCTDHLNTLVIYKEKSVWVLIGDPYTGTLERIEDGIGLTSAFAVAKGRGLTDYFVSPGGLRRCDTTRTEEFGPDIRPLFTSYINNAGSDLLPPGSIKPGPNYLTNSLDCYGIALGYAMGKLYISYDEVGR
jgi:hypothetical protein